MSDFLLKDLNFAPWPEGGPDGYHWGRHHRRYSVTYASVSAGPTIMTIWESADISIGVSDHRSQGASTRESPGSNLTTSSAVN